MLAARLTEDPRCGCCCWKPAAATTPRGAGPGRALQVWRTRRDWNYTTDPQPGLGGRELYWPRGKLLGGSSSINAMIYIRGGRRDYDEWASSPATTAGPTPTCCRSSAAARTTPAAPTRSTASAARSGSRTCAPRTAGRRPSSRPPSRPAIPRNDDFNGARQEGVGTYQVTQKRGRRWSAADAFLKPALDRPNLTVRTGAQVTRVLLEATGRPASSTSPTASGTTVHAGAEVVLAGGAINSPQLLMLSGIGPADHLRAVGVDVAHDLPGVGGGLQDHPLVPTIWHVRSGKSLFRAESPAGYAQWFGARRGPLTSNLAEAGLFTRSSPELPEPDLQYHFLPVKFWRQAEVDPDVDAFTAATVLVHVHSRGSVRLRSADPTWAPAIDAGYLTDRRDLDALVTGMERARDIASVGPLAGVLAEEWSPGGDGARPGGARGHGPGDPRVAVPPGRLLPDGHGRRRRGRPAAPGARRPGTAGGRRLGDAHAGPGQHQRPDDHDRRTRVRPDQGRPRRPVVRRPGLTGGLSVQKARGFRYRKPGRGATRGPGRRRRGRARRAASSRTASGACGSRWTAPRRRSRAPPRRTRRAS